MKPARVDASDGISVRTAVLFIVIGLLILIASVGGVFFWLRADNLRLQRAMAEEKNLRLKDDLERERLARVARQEMAQNRLTDALALVRAATNNLETLIETRRSLIRDSISIRTNAIGIRLVAFPDLVAQARYLFDTEFRSLPQEGEIAARLESVRRTEMTLASKVGTIFEIDPQISSSAHSQIAWAEEAGRRINQSRAALEALVTESRIKVLPEVVPTNSLGSAIEKLVQSEELLRRMAQKQSEKEAQESADVRLNKAKAEAVKGEAEIEAQRIEKAQQFNRDQAERERARVDALNQKAETEARLAKERTMNEANRLVLKRKAEDSKVKAILAPFIEPGYMTARGGITTEKRPISFKELKSLGALEPGEPGLKKLITVAYTQRDKVRPRWKFRQNNRDSFLRYPEDMERVTEAQALLIELGDVMVELGMLDP